jgi:hypothetical protein
LRRGDDQARKTVVALETEAKTLRADLEAASQRLEVLDKERIRERDALVAELVTLRQTVEASAQAASHAMPPIAEASAPVSAAEPQAPSAPPAAATMVPGGEEGWGPIRLASRYVFREPITVQANGDSGLLFDLSVTGCQLVSTNAMRPNQMVKVLLPIESGPLTCAGKVMWARFEPATAGRPNGYRGGSQFTRPDQDAIEAFINSKI